MVSIRTRAAWGARHEDGAGRGLLPATEGVFFHHSDGAPRNGDAAIRDLEATGEARFGAGISYTFPISPDGTVYQGHSIDRRGSHTKDHNTRGRAIVLIGNYEHTDPTPEQLESSAQLLAHGVREGWWPTTRLRGHKEVRNTDCPGARAFGCIPGVVARARQLLDGAGRPTPQPEEDVMATIDELEELIDRKLEPLLRRAAAVRDPGDRRVWIVSPSGRWHAPNRDVVNALVFLGTVSIGEDDEIPEADPDWLAEIPVIPG